MKRLLCVLLLVCMISSAGAELTSSMVYTYNSYAITAGAPELDAGQALSENSTYMFNLDPLYIVFEMSPLGGIRNGAVYAKDETCAADYLCSCLAMIWYLGEFDIRASGMLINQFSALRAGHESTPYNIGADAFNIIKSDFAQYAFVYMNNDGKSN